MSDDDPFENDPVLTSKAKDPPILIDLGGKRIVLGSVPAVEKQDGGTTTRFDLSVVRNESKTHPLILDVEINEEDALEDEESLILRLHLSEKAGVKLRSMLDEVLSKKGTR